MWTLWVLYDIMQREKLLWDEQVASLLKFFPNLVLELLCEA